MWFGILMIILAFIINDRGRIYLDNVIANFTPQEKLRYDIPLHDIIHSLTSDMREYRWIPDTIVGILGILALTYFTEDLNFLMIVTSSVYNTRTCAFISTIIPKCRLINVDEKPKDSSIIKKIIFILFYGHNHDLIVSGHMAISTTIICHWTYYQLLNLPLLAICWSLLPTLGLLLTICRCHYTCDCLLGFFIALAIYLVNVVVLHKWLPSYNSAKQILEYVL